MQTLTFNAHEMSTIRYVLQRQAREEFGPHVQQARLLSERLDKTFVVEKNVFLNGALTSQEAYDKLMAHARHGFKHGHFKGSFYLDGGRYDFETKHHWQTYKEDYHNGDFRCQVPFVEYSFTPSGNAGTLNETVEMET